MISRFIPAALLAIAATLYASPSAAADLIVAVESLRNNDGQVIICVFNADDAAKGDFPDCVKGHPQRMSKAPATGGRASVTFTGLKDGVYVVAMIHDENGNGAMDTNFLGIPAEGVGVSTNPSLMGKPRFDQAQFTLKGKMSIRITAKYIL
jgi:uncharacterized protein (DUF2141 family)